MRQQVIRRRMMRLGASCLLLAGAAGAALGAGAADMPKGTHGCDAEQHGPPGPHGQPGPLGPPPMELGFGEDRPPPYLIDAALTEDQQDKVFSILHGAAPEMRERGKAARKAREALRALGQSADFDAAKAAALAQAQAAADSQLALLMARTDHDIFLVLTPEQRARLHDHAAHAHDGPPPR